MEAVFQPEFFVFFLLILINFLCVPLGINQKRSEMIMKNSGRNTASTKSPGGPGNGQFLAGFLDLGGDERPSNTKNAESIDIYSTN